MRDISYSKLTDSFERGDIDVSKFGHVEHVAVAYELLHRYDFITAMSKYAKTIDRLARNAGAPEKFNVTITIAFLSIIAERKADHDYGSVRNFLERNGDLLSNNPLLEYYSADRLATDAARTHFLLPDLLEPTPSAAVA